MTMATPDPNFEDDLKPRENGVEPDEPGENGDVPVADENKASWLDYVNLIITRIVFAIHLTITTWKCVEYVENNLYYGLLVIGLVIMAVETVFAVFVRKARGYKWVSPTIMIYLYTILPMIWRLELYMFDQRVEMRDKLKSGEGSSGKAITNADGETTFVAEKDTTTQLEIEREWVSNIEQVLIFTLIIGRWMLPKGEMTRDEVTRLLMSYIGMSADIIGFFEAFTVFEVMYNQTLTYIILVSWSVAILQFAFVIVAAQRKVALTQYTDDGEFHEAARVNFGCGILAGAYCCDSEVVGCLVIMGMQDLPFFLLRLVMSIGFGATHYMHTFFIGKNILVCIIMIYKMFGASIDRGMKQDYSEIDE